MNRSTVLVQGLGLGVLSPKLVFPAGRILHGSNRWKSTVLTKSKPIGCLCVREARSEVLYWYQDSEMTFGGEFNYRMKLFERQILGGRTDGAVVRVVTPIRDYEDVEQAQDRLKSLALYLYPRLVQLAAY